MPRAQVMLPTVHTYYQCYISLKPGLPDVVEITMNILIAPVLNISNGYAKDRYETFLSSNDTQSPRSDKHL